MNFTHSLTPSLCEDAFLLALGEANHFILLLRDQGSTLLVHTETSALKSPWYLIFCTKFWGWKSTNLWCSPYAKDKVTGPIPVPEFRAEPGQTELIPTRDAPRILTVSLTTLYIAPATHHGAATCCLAA